MKLIDVLAVIGDTECINIGKHITHRVRTYKINTKLGWMNQLDKLGDYKNLEVVYIGAEQLGESCSILYLEVK